MQSESSEPRSTGDSRLERAIVLELLSDGGSDGRSQTELGEALGAGASELEAAVHDLHAAGVLELDEGRVSPSAATLRLDELELIGI
jgi:DNA-binding IclR family transcriptional regulator